MWAYRYAKINIAHSSRIQGALCWRIYERHSFFDARPCSSLLLHFTSGIFPVLLSRPSRPHTSDLIRQIPLKRSTYVWHRLRFTTAIRVISHAHTISEIYNINAVAWVAWFSLDSLVIFILIWFASEVIASFRLVVLEWTEGFSKPRLTEKWDRITKIVCF